MPIASRRTVYLMLALVMLLWSGNSVVARALRDDVPPFTLAFWRWAGALLIVLPLCWRPILRDAALIRRHWLIIAVLGLLGVGAFSALFYSGLQYTTAANALLIQAAIPALVLALDFLIFRVRSRPLVIIGVMLAATGVVAIMAKGDPMVLATLSFNRGDALIFIAVLLWSLYTVLLRLRPPIQGWSFLGVTIAMGAIVMLPFALVEQQTRAVHLSPAVIGGIAYVMIFPSVIAYYLYNVSVEAIGAGDAGQVINLQPLFGALLAALVLGEPIHGYHIAGMILILAGIGLPIVTNALKGGSTSRPATATVARDE